MSLLSLLNGHSLNANGDRCLYIGIRKVFARLAIAATLTILSIVTDRRA